MKNRYLSDRASRRMRMSRDGRTPYGSRGRNRGNDRGMDYNYSMPEYDSRYDYRGNSYDRGQDYHRGSKYPREHSRPMQYELYGVGGMRPRMDYNYDYDYGYDYGYDYAKESEKEYEKDLHEWAEKLKKKDRFGWSKEQVVQQSRNMGVKFEEYDEMEFYVTYLMQMSDYPKVANEPHTYLAMAKEWLEDDDVELKGSEKLCAYLYTIVKGEEE